MMKNEIKKILIDYGVEGEEYSDLEEYLSELLAEIKRLREGIKLIADDTHENMRVKYNALMELIQ
jgi:hypothetical protein